jgi:hypothetical protein
VERKKRGGKTEESLAVRGEYCRKLVEVRDETSASRTAVKREETSKETECAPLSFPKLLSEAFEIMITTRYNNRD